MKLVQDKDFSLWGGTHFTFVLPSLGSLKCYRFIPTGDGDPCIVGLLHLILPFWEFELSLECWLELSAQYRFTRTSTPGVPFRIESDGQLFCQFPVRRSRHWRIGRFAVYSGSLMLKLNGHRLRIKGFEPIDIAICIQIAIPEIVYYYSFKSCFSWWQHPKIYDTLLLVGHEFCILSCLLF